MKTENLPFVMWATIAVWGALLFLLALGVVGATVHAGHTYRSLPFWLVIFMGALMAAGNTFAFFSARPRAELQAGEEVLVARHPSMKPALFFAGAGVLLAIGSLILLYGVEASYVLYLATTIWVFFCCWQAVTRYWLNHYSTYYVTNQRIVRLYRLLKVADTDIQTDDVNGVRLGKSPFQRITNRGTVTVTSGGGNRQTQVIPFRDIDDPNKVRDIIRRFI